MHMMNGFVRLKQKYRADKIENGLERSSLSFKVGPWLVASLPLMCRTQGRRHSVLHVCMVTVAHSSGSPDVTVEDCFLLRTFKIPFE